MIIIDVLNMFYAILLFKYVLNVVNVCFMQTTPLHSEYTYVQFTRFFFSPPITFSIPIVNVNNVVV